MPKIIFSLTLYLGENPFSTIATISYIFDVEVDVHLRRMIGNMTALCLRAAVFPFSPSYLHNAGSDDAPNSRAQLELQLLIIEDITTDLSKMYPLAA